MEGWLTRLEQAYQAGRWARESGRPISSRPMYGPTDQCAELRKEWERGWKDEEGKK